MLILSKESELEFYNLLNFLIQFLKRTYTNQKVGRIIFVHERCGKYPAAKTEGVEIISLGEVNVKGFVNAMEVYRLN